MFHSIGSLFKFNLLLQIFDGLFTYHVVSQQGLPEANPLVRNTIYEWGVVWGIVYWKLLACALLGLIFTFAPSQVHVDLPSAGRDIGRLWQLFPGGALFLRESSIALTFALGKFDRRAPPCRETARRAPRRNSFGSAA